MDLTLHDDDPDPALAALADHRHLPPGKAFFRPPKSRHHQLSSHKAEAWCQRYESTHGLGASDPASPPCPNRQREPRELRPHQLAALAAYHRSSPGASSHRGLVRVQSRRRWAPRPDDDEEGRELARSDDVSLPSDGHRGGGGGGRSSSRRPPSLERQEAFRAVRIASAACWTAPPSPDWQEDAADEAELYRLGLLYDDEHERGPGFSLDAIAREQPAYTVGFRRAGRRGWSKEMLSDLRLEEFKLPLNLSFSLLSDDPAIAQFLISPSAEELSAFEPCDKASFDTSRPSCPSTQFDSCFDGSPAHDSHSLETQRTPDLAPDDSGNDDEEEEDEDEDWLFLRQRRIAGECMDADTDEESGRASGRESPSPWVMLG